MIDKNQRNPEESDLEKGLEKPKITLKPLKNTAVSTPIQEEYIKLMQVYDCGGWIWGSGDLPTQHNRWENYKEKTCVSARNKFGFGTAGVGFKEEKIITTQDFYKKQKIPQEKIKEIQNYFETITKK